MTARIIPTVALIGAAALLWFALTPNKQSPIKRTMRAIRPSTSRVPVLDFSPKTDYTPRSSVTETEFFAFEPVNYLKSGASVVSGFTAQFKNGLRNVSPTILNLLRGAANAHSVPANILTAQAFAESSFNPNAKSPTSNAYGLMQLIPCWHPGTPVQKPVDNAYRGAEYMRENFDRFGDWYHALIAFKEGPTLLAKLGANSNDPRIARGRAYADKIMTAAKVYA